MIERRRRFLTDPSSMLFGLREQGVDLTVGEIEALVRTDGALWSDTAKRIDPDLRRWGFGAEQSFDTTGLLLYAQAHHYEATVIGYPCDTVPAPSPETCGGDPNNLAVLPTKPWFGFVTGARIRF